MNETRTYDARLRLAGITDGSVYNVSIPSTGGYAPDGDILQAVDSVNTTWSYVYDPLNRLCGANQSATQPICAPPSGLYTYAYDRFGNRWQQNGPHAMSLSFSGNNNRMDSYSYDAAGNLLNDGTTTYTYDSESRIISATNGSGVSSYVYDANGRRIRKITPTGGTVDFLYDLAGHEITQVSSTGSWTRGEVYAGDRHIATYSGGTGGTTYFNFSDWLGTERARSLAGAPTACETVTTLPFGDGQTTSGSCGDPSPMHFTGKERDSESGLDNFGARYYSPQYGRFMTPDWSGKPQGVPYARFDDPQSLNLYSYMRNNPVLRPDVDGHCFDPVSCGLEFAGGGSFFGPVGTGIGAGVGLLVGTAIVLEAVHVMRSENTQSSSDTAATSTGTSRPGTLGKPDHQQTAAEEAARIGGQREVPIQTPGGAKDSRRADAAVTDSTGKVTGEVVQVYRPTPAGNIPKREQQAATDIQNATGVTPTMVPVRPLPPPPPPQPPHEPAREE